MKRRSLFLVPLLAFPARLFGQDPVRRPSAKTAKGRQVSDSDDTPTTPRRSRDLSDDTEPASVDSGPGTGAQESLPANFPAQTGFQLKTFAIGDYTALDPGAASPQTAIIEWIFRRTTTAPWHGDKLAGLCASKTQLRAFNSAKILGQVKEVVERFTDQAQANLLTVRVRFIAASDSRWRYAVLPQLTPVGNGPQGQQIWFASETVGTMVVRDMQAWQGFEMLGERSAVVLNGQTLKFDQLGNRTYNGGVERQSAVGLGFQPKVEKLLEGVSLKFSPLLSYEGDTLDAAIELTTNVVRKLHPVKVLAPKEVGPGELTIEVPEVSETRLNRPVTDWPLGQTLIISAGIQPGILMNKGGLFNLKIPGTVPTGTEVLVVINVELVKEKKTRERAPAARNSPE